MANTIFDKRPNTGMKLNSREILPPREADFKRLMINCAFLVGGK